MFKFIVALASFGVVLALSPAQAQMMTCSQAEITNLEADAAKMTDATKKSATMKRSPWRRTCWPRKIPRPA